jgi:hypothetical protein
MDNSINNIGQNGSVLRGFQRVFDQPGSSMPGRTEEKQNQIRTAYERSEKAEVRKTVDVKFYASSGSVSTINPGDKGNNFDINV